VNDQDTSSVNPGRIERDKRLDLARGLALICIYIDHLPGNFFSRFTLHAYTFNDAAEVFILIAGIAAGLAYWGSIGRNGVLRGSTRVLKRIAQVYGTHVLLVGIGAAALSGAASLTGNSALLGVTSYASFAGEPFERFWHVLVLRLQPNYLNILPLYVLLLALLPAMFLLKRVHWGLLLGASFGAWLLPRAFGFNLPSDLHGPGWYFNPFAWQLLFVIGLLWGEAWRRGGGLPRHPLLPIAAALYGVFALVAVASWAKVPHFSALRVFPVDWMTSVDKEHLSLLRALNVLALAYLFVYLVPASASWLESGTSRAIRAMGRAPLTVFATSAVANVVGWSFWFQGGQSVAWQVAMIAAGLAMMTVAAYYRELPKPWRWGTIVSAR